MIDSSHRPAAKSLASASFKSGQSIASCRASASRQKSGWQDPWTRGPRRSAPARRDRVRGGVEQPLPARLRSIGVDDAVSPQRLKTGW